MCTEFLHNRRRENFVLYFCQYPSADKDGGTGQFVSVCHFL
jgi:hypothetical protein